MRTHKEEGNVWIGVSLWTFQEKKKEKGKYVSFGTNRKENAQGGKKKKQIIVIF